MASEKAISRRRPLQTCASSISGVISTAYRISPQLNGPLGNFTKHLTPFATSSFPFASKLQDLGQTIISLTDDHILFHERIAEFVFPPSRIVFDKIDKVVRSIEEFPHRSRHGKEKEILIDVNFEHYNNPIESESSEKKAQEQFNLSSNEFTESEDKEKSVEEALDKSMADSSNDSAYSSDKEKIDEDLSQSVMNNCNEFVDSPDKEALIIQSMVMINEPEKENSAEIQEQSSMLNKNEESKENANAMNTIISPGESFQSADFEYITSSSSVTSDSFLEDEPFEHIEIPSNDEDDENNDKAAGGKDKKVKFSFLAISSSKNKRVFEKGIIGKGKKKDDKKGIIGKGKKKIVNNEDDDKGKIFELIEAKGHMM